jgi:hypothetical protein
MNPLPSHFHLVVLAAAVTLISHSLNLLLVGTYLIVAEIIHGQSNDIPEIIVFMIAGVFISLFKSGLITFCINLLSGFLTILLFYRRTPYYGSGRDNIEIRSNTTGNTGP